jgi:hypothetical protein
MWWKDHLFISTFMGIFYFIFTRNIVYSLLIFSSSFFIDIDHYFLYFIVERKNFKETYKMFQEIDKKEMSDPNEDKYVLPFHNFEFVFLIIFLSIFYSFLIPIAIGVLIHFVIDVSYLRKFRIKHYYSAIYYAFSKLS